MEENPGGVSRARKRWRRAAPHQNERLRNGDKRLQQVINSLYQPPPYEATATANLRSNLMNLMNKLIETEFLYSQIIGY
jgi:hypothetical protein